MAIDPLSTENNYSPVEVDAFKKFNFKYLPAYAKYLLQEKAEAFAAVQIDIARQINLPLLNRLENLSKEELPAFVIAIITEMLNACSRNEGDEYINKVLEKWIVNQLPFISKNQLEAEDITLIGFVQRNAFKKFIHAYTTDAALANHILYEADVFITTTEAACMNALFKTQQQLFTQAQMLSHIGNWHWDIKTNKLFWSNEIYNIYELPHQAEITFEEIGKYNHPADDAAIDWHLSTSLQSRKPHDFFYRIILKDGRQKYLQSKGEIKFDAEGNALEIAGTLQDVTEQKQKEKELNDSSKFIEKIADISPCIIAVFNVKKGSYTYVNKGIEAILGYTANSFLKEDSTFFYELVHEEDLQALKEKNKLIIAEANQKEDRSTEKIYEHTYRLLTGNKTYKWIQTYTTVFSRDHYNKVIDILNVSLDITESQLLTLQLKKINEEIRSKELQHQRMISEVEDYAIILLDKEGFIQTWNKGAEKIKGYMASEIIGKNFRQFYRREDIEKKLPDSLLETATLKGGAQHEGWRVRKDDSTFWGSVVITALHDENNNLIGFSKVTRNLTERKLAEDKLREYARKIEKHNEELQRINKELDSFTYMASHDLQEPLRKIRTFANIILSKASENFSADVNNYFERILASAGRMQTLIDSLLNYSRAGKTELKLEPTELSLIIEEVKKELAETIEEKKITLTYGPLPVLKIERLQFHQLFFNLIENALKYSREDVQPQINITATTFFKEDEHLQQNEFARITISDNGIGFEQQYAENIFKLFQRLHGRSEYSGTGIGLAICKKIVENHQGNITALGKPGEGATFVIELPTGMATT